MQLKDSRRIWQIRNADVNRIFMNNQGKIAWADHQEWFRPYLKKALLSLVLTKNNRVIGYLRFDQKGRKKIAISIAIDPGVKGRGLGSYLLKESIAQYEHKLNNYTIFADVKHNNLASNKLFDKCNFRLISKTKKYHTYRYDYPRVIIIATNHDWGIRPKMIKTKYKIIFITQKNELSLESIKKINPRYIFFPHWSWLIPEDIWQRYECIVFHMTDLPYGRGGTPLQNLIWRGHAKTKISALRVVTELDAGPVYLKKPLSLSGRAKDIYHQANHIIITMINDIIKQQPKPKPQHGRVVIFKRRTPDQSQLPNNIPLKKLYDFIRMLDAPGYPKAYLQHGNYKLEFTNATVQGSALKANIKLYEKK